MIGLSCRMTILHVPNSNPEIRLYKDGKLRKPPCSEALRLPHVVIGHHGREEASSLFIP